MRENGALQAYSAWQVPISVVYAKIYYKAKENVPIGHLPLPAIGLF